jgi:hypothetical protein
VRENKMERELDKAKKYIKELEKQLQESYDHHVPHKFVREELYKQSLERIKELELVMVVCEELDKAKKYIKKLKEEEKRMDERNTNCPACKTCGLLNYPPDSLKCDDCGSDL